MLDVETPLITAGFVAVVGAAVQFYGILQDRKHARSQDKRDDDKEPLLQKSMELGMMDQATVIMQRMIDSQEEEIKKLTKSSAAKDAENAQLRHQMMDMYLQIREAERRNGSLPPPSA